MSLYSNGFSAFLSAVTLANALEYKMKKEDTEIKPPVDTVSIIIPAYNEQDFITDCLYSLRRQSIVYSYPNYFEYILVDSKSTDKTVELAKPYIDTIIKGERGKLNAKNLGIVNSKGNIIVSVDADIIYPFHWLNTLLKPFNEPDVVAVGGSIYDDSIPNVPTKLNVITSSIDRYIIHPTRLMGGNSAYYKHLFYINGMFNTKVNQNNVRDMINEEEINFGNKLSKYGKVVYKHNAYGNHLGGQRIACRYGLQSKIKCEKFKIGIERFG